VNLPERQAAAAMLRECRAALAARGSTVIGEATGSTPADIVDWRHYPEGEVYDAKTHVQYFYHRHPAPAPARRPPGPAEHGHFHLFLRGEGIPAGMAPLLLPELAVADPRVTDRQSAPLKQGGRDEVCHLVAIALDELGEPIRLMATNRWVTGETWYRADDVIRMLGRFRLAADGPAALLNRWLGALVSLFQPETAALLRQRDKAIAERRWRWRTNVFEDPRLEVIAGVDIDLDSRLAAIEAAAAAPPIAAAVRRRPRLPPMAEGWGA
jgi:hypothetical protein